MNAYVLVQSSRQDSQLRLLILFFLQRCVLSSRAFSRHCFMFGAAVVAVPCLSCSSFVCAHASSTRGREPPPCIIFCLACNCCFRTVPFSSLCRDLLEPRSCHVVHFLSGYLFFFRQPMHLLNICLNSNRQFMSKASEGMEGSL